MLTIGRFADATGLTVKALRHYDAIGLLEPAHVGAATGYRYYDSAQVEVAVAIRRLRALELPLDEIRELLAADADGVRDRLAAHGYRVTAEAHDKLMLLIELAALVEGGGDELSIELRDEPELRLAAQIRQLHHDDVGVGIERMARAVRSWLREHGGEPATALFRSGDRERWHLVEAGWPVAGEVEGDDEVAVQTYAASRAATYEYRGPVSELHPVAQRLIATVLGQGLRSSQPIRIEYLDDAHARIVWPIE